MNAMRRHVPMLLLALASAAACGGSDGKGGGTTSPPVDTSGVAFVYVPPAGAPAVTSISVPGTFNNWSTSANPMTKRADGSWVTHIPLANGRYQYKFYINGAWPTDMCGDATWGVAARDNWIDTTALGCVDDLNGGENAVRDIGTASSTDIGFLHDPTVAAQLSEAGGLLSVRFQSNARAVQSAALVSGGQSYPMVLQLSYQLRDVWRGTLPSGATSYSITVRTATDTTVEGPFIVPGSLFHAVPWVAGSVGYQIFPERFWNGDHTNDHFTTETDEYNYLDPSLRGAPPSLASAWNAPETSQGCCHQYYGGDLQGIIDKLDHLQAIGVNFIYMNPIWSSGSAHGYDTWDYLQVEPSFGDTTVLRALLTAAHARGMKVMWDFVPNHTGVGHWAFQDAVHNGTASPEWPWYTFKVPASQIKVGDPNSYVAWAGAGGLPKLNTANADAFAYLMGVVSHWTTFGFDGIRVDVPNELSNGYDFFRTMRTTAKGINPNEYLVGEIWQRNASWLQGDQFDALMNYAEGRDIVLSFVNGNITGGGAMRGMAQLYAEYPEAVAAMEFNLIDSHDTPRLLTDVGGGSLGATPGATALAKQRLASAILYALPGMPITWQGDECAQLGTGSETSQGQNRYPVQWDACSAAMQAHYTQLANLKHTIPALSSSAIRFYQGSGSVLAFYRGEPGAGEVLAVFNAGATASTVTLPAGSWTDAVSGQSASGSTSVDALGWRYLRRQRGRSAASRWGRRSRSCSRSRTRARCLAPRRSSSARRTGRPGASWARAARSRPRGTRQG